VLVERMDEAYAGLCASYCAALGKACVGLGHIVALHHRSSTSYQIH
jgi:hypothetical protein